MIQPTATATADEITRAMRVLAARGGRAKARAMSEAERRTMSMAMHAAKAAKAARKHPRRLS